MTHRTGEFHSGSDWRDTNEGAAGGEHWIAWFFAALALVLGAIGLLAGFGVFGDTANEVGGQAGETIGETGQALTATGDWRDGVLWLLPAIAAGFLSLAFHRTEHHRTRSSANAEGRLFKFEHLLAYVMAVATVVAGTLGLLVGFDVFDNGNTAEDGMVWHLAAITYGVLTCTLHAVRHHAMAEDEDYIVGIVERRVGTLGPAGTTRTTGTTVQETHIDRP